MAKLAQNEIMSDSGGEERRESGDAGTSETGWTRKFTSPDGLRDY